MLYSFLAVSPVQPASRISALTFLEDHWNYRPRKTLGPLVCTTHVILSHVSTGAEPQKLRGVSEEQVPMILNHLDHLQWKSHVTGTGGLAGSSVSFQQVWGPRCHLASSTVFPLLQCFCRTSGMHLYWLPKQRLPRFYQQRSYLSNWSTAWSPTQAQWKASWEHRLILKASLRQLKFQEEKLTHVYLHTDTKESLRALKVPSTWFSWAGGLIPFCTAPDLHCSPWPWGRYALLSSGTPWGRHCFGCTTTCLSWMQKNCPMTYKE